jgi:hypothetical protein
VSDSIRFAIPLGLILAGYFTTLSFSPVERGLIVVAVLWGLLLAFGFRHARGMHISP